MNVENLSGRRLGRYQLRELMGLSAMSAVYHGYQTDLERHVAVKVLSPSLAQEGGYIERFTLEARTVASLEHPHIVPVYDYGVIDGLSFVVMRLLSGGTLAQRLDQRLMEGGSLPSLQEIANLIRQLASALDYAHSRGVIHRDVKSGNVMFDRQGAAYLVDFGIARLIYRSSSLTDKNIVFGTPSHMAPEQWRDEPATPATDQYALGVLTYVLLTGVLPFGATAPHAYMYKHLNEAPTPPHQIRPDIPDTLTPVLERVLAKQPEDRYPTVIAFAEAFSDAAEGLSGEPTDFFTFSLSPATMPIAAVAAEALEADAEPYREVSEPQSPIAAPIVPPLMPAHQIERTPPRTTTGKPNYVLLILVGAVVGILLLAVFASVALFALTLMNDGANQAAAIEQQETVLPTGTLPTIPTLTPGISTSQAVIPTPAITSIARANPAPLSVPASIITPTNAAEVVQQSSFLTDAIPVRSVAFSIDGSLVASGNGDNTIRLWNVASGATQAILQGHGGIVYGVAFSPNGTLLASASGDGTIRLWDAASGTALTTLQGHTGAVRSVAFSPDGSLLASAGEDGTVRLWDVATGVQQALLNGHTQRVLSVAFSPDGATLASGGLDANVILWDVATGAQVKSFTGHQDEIRMVAFNPNGMTLASASADNTIHIWDVNNGAALAVLREHGRDVFGVAYSPDGSVLASGGRDNTVRLWNAQTGEQLTVLQGHTGWVFDVAFSADGGLLASAGGDGTVRIWGL